MTVWFWSQWQDFALGCAVIYSGFILLGLGRWASVDAHGLAAQVCGTLATAFAGLALLWAAHLGDKWHLLP